MSSDIIEKTTGRFGKYQITIAILITLGRLPSEFQLYNVVFVVPNVKYICLDDNAFNVTNHCPCGNPQYDDSEIINSVTSEWNLICGRSALASLLQSMVQIGILPGSLIYGWISDRYGRRLAVYLSLLLSSIFVSLSAIVPQLWMFMVLRFLIGTTIGGAMLCSYVILLELFGTTFRYYVVAIHEICTIVSYFFLPIIAFYVREWRYLQLALAAPWLFVVTYYWMIPESPRWLITVGRKQEAINVLKTIAKRNGHSSENIEEIINEMEKVSKNADEQHHGTYLDLFKTPKIRVYSIVNALIWMISSHIYYGINQYIGRLQGNLYLNVLLSALCLIPGIVFVLVTIKYLRRKVSVPLSFSIAASSLLLFLVIPNNLQSVTVTFAILGQVGIYSAFVQLYLLSAEIFPTVIRNSALGFASMTGRVGSFIAPFVVNIGIEWVTIVIFSALSFSAALLCYFLPETKDAILLNTVEQTEQSEVVRSDSSNNSRARLDLAWLVRSKRVTKLRAASY